MLSLPLLPISSLNLTFFSAAGGHFKYNLSRPVSLCFTVYEMPMWNEFLEIFSFGDLLHFHSFPCNTFMVILLLLSSFHLEFSWCSPAWCDRARLLGSWPNLSRESPLGLTSLCPETTCPPPASQNPPALRSSFQSKTYFSTAPIIVLACTSPIRVSTCRGAGQRAREKLHKNSGLSLFFSCAVHFCELVETLNVSKVLVTKFWEISTYPCKGLLRSEQTKLTNK